MSDQHGCMPDVPPCDLLLVAGDICPDRVQGTVAMFRPELQQAWFDRMIRPWFSAAPAQYRVATWGNHDFCGERCDFSADSPSRADPAALVIGIDELVQIPRAAGTPALRVWTTPWSAAFGDWAFMKSAGELAAVYAQIPANIDILVTHQPPYGYGDLISDLSGDTMHVGSRELLAAIERVRPRLVVCGHIHGGHGRYQHDGIPICNVSVVDERYRNVHQPTVIDL